MAARSSPNKYQLLLAAILAIAIAAMLKAYGRGTVDANGADTAADKTPAIVQAASLTVSVEKVRKDEIASAITATGTVQAWQEATIGSQTSGLQLTEVLVAEGGHVGKGEVIARLDDTVLRAELAEQKAAVEQARATLEAAETASARAQKLIASNAISIETAEERATTVKTSRAQLVQAQAADNIAAQLARTEIRAPFDGTVSTRPAVAGSIVQSGTELMKIVRAGKVEVAVQMPEKDLAVVTTDQAATITDASGRAFSGRVSSIAEKVDGTTRLGTVYVAPQDNSGLRPGMFARVSIATSAAQVLNVAESALTWRDGRPSVFVVGEGGNVTARSVETGSRKAGRVAIASGLAEGDSVVVSGAGLLNDGNLVRVAAGDSGQAVSSTETVR